MALITCPECGNKVSDLAPMCPNCGYPIAAMCKGNNSSTTIPKSLPSRYKYVECSPSEYTIRGGKFKYSGASDAINIPDKATTITHNSFKKKVKAVFLGKNIESVEKAHVEWFDVDADNPFFASIDGVLFSKDKTTIVRYPSLSTRSEYAIPLFVKTVKADAFFDAKLKKVILHDDLILEGNSFCGAKMLETIQWADHKYPDNTWPEGKQLNYGVFAGTGITDFQLPNNITVLNNALASCPIRNISIPQTVKHITRSALYGCKNLKEIVIPESVETIGECAFENCESLEQIIIPQRVTVIPDGCFSGCKSLKSVVLPMQINAIGDHAFGCCESLEYCRLPDGLSEIPKRCFKECRNLKGVIIPKAVKVIGEYAFYQCEALTNILLPHGLKIIDQRAFCYCKSIETILLPDGIEIIGDSAFCLTGIKTIRVPDSVKDITSLCDEIHHVDISASTLSRMSEKTRQDKARWDDINASFERIDKNLAAIKEASNKGEFFVYQKNAKRLVKNREANKARLATLLASRSLYAYNNLLLETNEINKTPICVYNECGQSLKLYSKNGLDGTFAIEINGRAYTLNQTEYEIKNKIININNDASQLDKAIMAGIAGGPLLGWLATSTAQAYSTIDIHIPFINKKTGEEVEIVFGDHYKAHSSMAQGIMKKVQYFWEKLTNIIDSISPEEMAAAGYINLHLDEIKRML